MKAPTLVTLESNYANKDGVALTIHFSDEVTEEQVKEFCRTKRKDYPRVSLWVDYTDEFFEVVQVRKGVWQAHPTG
jgi:hypothetical protein